MASLKITRDSRQWRLIDTGLRNAAENIAINQAMLEAHQQCEIPHTIRFLQFKPCALIGFHQSASQELRLDYCKDNNIEIQRRITGGGAIYFDETQIGWELYVNKEFMGTADMSEISRRICEAAAKGISNLGVEAKFRPRNDIEVEGKKISGTGGTFDGNSILFQGTLLIQFDVEKMMRILRIPAEKLTDKAITSARERVANLADLIGNVPSMAEVKNSIAKEFANTFKFSLNEEADLSHAEQQRYQQALQEIQTDQWINQVSGPISDAPVLSSVYRCDGGTFRVSVLVNKHSDRIKQIWITGDFFVNPKRIVVDLEAALKDIKIADLKTTVYSFFKDTPVEMLQLSVNDFYLAIEKTLETMAHPEVIA